MTLVSDHVSRLGPTLGITGPRYVTLVDHTKLACAAPVDAIVRRRVRGDENSIES